ncbi:MAG: DUF134 domain-containing protein [Methanomicrobiaceae archaeon]|nr:DUF134 domain-containing protein [Methanomicrobiaceae archaeon]
MNGQPFGRGFRRGRGRRRVERFCDPGFRYRCFAPVCRSGPPAGSVSLRPDEVEVLRLVDLQGLTQDEAALTLGVSRKTVWRDLHEARRKVADALVHGRFIEIAGCDEVMRDTCGIPGVEPDEDE